jgi:hypothetical protein
VKAQKCGKLPDYPLGDSNRLPTPYFIIDGGVEGRKTFPETTD